MRARAWLPLAFAATTACATGRGATRPCAVGLALVDGACLGPAETDDYCGARSITVDGTGACVVPTCAPGEAVDPVTSTCVARRAVAALGAESRAAGDDALLGCSDGRVLASHHDHVECLAREQVCPATSRWDTARGCVTEPPCKAGELRVPAGRDAGTCRPVLSASVVDVGAWARASLEDHLCRRLRRTPWEFMDSAVEGRVSLELELVLPNNDVAGATGTAHFDPPVPPEAAQASAQAALEALLIPLRALGGTADAASVSLHVTCPMDRGAAPRILPRPTPRTGS